MSDRVKFKGMAKTYVIPNAPIYREAIDRLLDSNRILVVDEERAGHSVTRVCLGLRQAGASVPTREEDRSAMLRALGYTVARGFVPKKNAAGHVHMTQPALVVFRDLN